MFSKDADEERLMHLKSHNIEIPINVKADEVIEEPFQSVLSRYPVGLNTIMKGSSFIFDHIHLLYYKYHEINPNCVGS